MTPQEIDRIVSDWSMTYLIPMSQEAQEALVNALALQASPDLSTLQ